MESEYYDDWLNGVDWHIPKTETNNINDDGSWNESPDE